MVIHHFHIDHNLPCLPFDLSLHLNFCITIVFNFSWVLQSSQEKFKTMVMQNFGELTRCIIIVHYGLCENGE